MTSLERTSEEKPALCLLRHMKQQTKSCSASKYHSPKRFFKTWKNGAIGWGYLRQICSVLVRVKRRVLSGMRTFRISSMKIDRNTPVSQTHTRSEFCVGTGTEHRTLHGDAVRGLFVWGAHFSNVNCAWINNFRVKIQKNCVGIAWGWEFWWIVNKSPFVGMKKNQHFAWGIRGDVPTHPHTN